MYYIFYQGKPYGTHIKNYIEAKKKLDTLSTCLKNLEIRRLGPRSCK